MPTYDYRCTRCENTFEVRQSFTDDALTECPLEGEDGVCGGEVKKVFGNVGIAFKGSGFYKTDSRSGSNGSSGSSGSASDSSGSSSDSSGSSSSDSKSDNSKSNGSKSDSSGSKTSDKSSSASASSSG